MKIVELKIKNEELELQVQKLTCALKIFMSKTTISQIDAINIVNMFDSASNNEQINKIYRCYLENN